MMNWGRYKEQPTTQMKLGARVKRIVEAKKEMSKFAFICMEFSKQKMNGTTKHN